MKSLNADTYVLLGAGGHSRSLLPLMRGCRCIVQGIFDQNFEVGNLEVIQGIPVIGGFHSVPRNSTCVIASGDPQQRSWLWRVFSQNRPRRNFLHKTSVIEENIRIGVGNQIFAMAFINSDVFIADNNILNSKCLIEHEVKVGSHNHVSVGALVCGRVTIGDRCAIGAGAVVRDHVTITDDVVIGAGAVVVDDLLDSGVYVGVPARRVN